ncbi:amino acid ABC transporter membrane protein 1, PAAT family [Pedococcus cremeus]|jgi:glutamate transport system permease protein|uniref:Amino acid ABC transporter membrane protein 1, PAAT family n=1 Tax=Pedococcus cremeus TaxID=587636 RepID=A0A1H9V300_9MICO|nr:MULTISPECIES: amino acid ABC transporter permease [Intrasporangiaceae]TQJ51248.1 amino acid ABC transporter membrane protein 1 (PAAT family) [Phycicoccus sp. SLBN-51]SES15627.1 amino acid ABC transporter membrane protein 1, PAAT family [Pedococcus cremeus]
MGDLSFAAVLSAFWLTIQLALFSAVGALVLGTIIAVMRVSPVRVLQMLGTWYVNTFRNTPLTLLMVFGILGATYTLGINLAPSSINDNNFRWAVVMLSVYHAAFVCEALRSGVNTVPAGQAEAARAMGLTFGQTMSQVILPQAFRGAIAPLGSTLIALIKNTTVAAVIGNQEAAGLMSETVENQGSSIGIFLIFALGFVILTLPLGLLFTSMSRRLVVKR